MIEQAKSVDYRARNVRFIEKPPVDFLQEALDVFQVCIWWSAPNARTRQQAREKSWDGAAVDPFNFHSPLFKK